MNELWILTERGQTQSPCMIVFVWNIQGEFLESTGWCLWGVTKGGKGEGFILDWHKCLHTLYTGGYAGVAINNSFYWACAHFCEKQQVKQVLSC